MAGIGVAVRNAEGNFREFDMILKDIHDRWSDLGNITQQNIAQTIAGTYHYSRFLALMENMDIATKATTLALNSENSALDENAKFLDSITGRLGILRSAIEESFTEAIPVDFFKTLISWVTILVEKFAN